MRGLKTDRTASAVIQGHGLIQNLRRGHYELAMEARWLMITINASTCPQDATEPPIALQMSLGAHRPPTPQYIGPDVLVTVISQSRDRRRASRLSAWWGTLMI